MRVTTRVRELDHEVRVRESKSMRMRDPKASEHICRYFLQIT